MRSNAAQLLCTLGRDELEKRLTTLRRKVANDQAEGAREHVVFGGWAFCVGGERSTIRDSPLAAAAVDSRAIARNAPPAPSFRLSRTDDEPRFNATLVEKLKRDLGVDLSAVRRQFATDDKGVDVPRVARPRSGTPCANCVASR
jgi:hypothetical protein